MLPGPSSKIFHLVFLPHFTSYMFVAALPRRCAGAHRRPRLLPTPESFLLRAWCVVVSTISGLQVCFTCGPTYPGVMHPKHFVAPTVHPDGWPSPPSLIHTTCS